MKRLFILGFLVLTLALSACQPPATSVENNVFPMIISTTVQDEGETLLIQGRYFGNGVSGSDDDSYVILGADVTGEGGVLVRPSEWSPTRIVVQVPEGVGSGFVYVVVNGVKSTGLPANLP